MPLICHYRFVAKQILPSPSFRCLHCSGAHCHAVLSRPALRSCRCPSKLIYIQTGLIYAFYCQFSERSSVCPSLLVPSILRQLIEPYVGCWAAAVRLPVHAWALSCQRSVHLRSICPVHLAAYVLDFCCSTTHCQLEVSDVRPDVESADPYARLTWPSSLVPARAPSSPTSLRMSPE